VIRVDARSVRSLRTSDLEQVVPFGAAEGGEAPVVDHEQVRLGQAGEGAEVGAIAAGDVAARGRAAVKARSQ
jgi:hypothetical protein